MAKEKEAAEGEGEEAAGGSKKKLIMIAAPVLLVVIGAALYFFVFAGSGSSDAAAKDGTSTSASDGSGDGTDTSADDGTDSSADSGSDSGGDSGTTSAAAPSPPAGQAAGKLVVSEPLTINLAGGHYLKVAIALQATAAAGEEVTASKALDAAITVFSGQTVDDLSSEEGRATAKKTLLKKVKKLYEDMVYAIYYTVFVMN